MADTLLLNADGLPVSLLPVSAIKWKQAINYLLMDKVHVLDWYDDWIVHSPSWETKVPAVIMLKKQMRRYTNPRYSKFNVMLRDMFTCQYCMITLPKKELTIDHVVPISKGGANNFENVVAACKPCNHGKGDSLTPRPRTVPHRPDYWELVSNRKKLDFEIKHQSWCNYLTDTETLM